MTNWIPLTPDEWEAFDLLPVSTLPSRGEAIAAILREAIARHKMLHADPSIDPYTALIESEGKSK